MEDVCEAVFSDYDRAVIHRLKSRRSQDLSENPGLAGESRAEDDLLAKTLRNVMGVVDAVRGGVTSLWM